MSIEVTYEDDVATFAVRPEFGRPVTFVVTRRKIDVSRTRSAWGRKNEQPRFVVGLKGSNGAGFSHHTTFEAACGRALVRARRYDQAYSRPRMMPKAVFA